MPMPSLAKYFAFVGAALLALITLSNFLLDPGTTGARPVTAQMRAVPAIQHDPRASKIERWRNEQAALKAAEQTQTSTDASVAAKSVSEPIRPPVQAAAAPEAQPAAQQAQPVAAQIQPVAQPAVAEAPMQSTDIAAQTEAAAAHAADAARIKLEKAKAAARAHKAKLARERARVRAEQFAAANADNPQGSIFQSRPASNQQDQYYYGQRGPRTAGGPGYAYAPQRTFGPFGWGNSW